MSTLDKWNVELNEMERKLRPPTIGLVPYEPKVIPLTTGEDMLVREARDEEIPAVLEAIKPLLDHEKDYYDIVAARIYAELLGKLRYRVQDEYLFWGLIDGELAGIVNGRIVNAKTGMSYHTMTLKRGARVGAQLFAAKMEYHFDFMNQDEVLIVAESPNGFRRWMIEYELESAPDRPHELGGVPTFVLTRALWEKHKGIKNVGLRPADPEIIKANEIMKPIAEIHV
jgi:hypothetical protein